MQVTKFITGSEAIEVSNIHKDFNRSQALYIGEYDDRVQLFFKDLGHMKQFEEQLSKQIKEIEK